MTRFWSTGWRWKWGIQFWGWLLFLLLSSLCLGSWGRSWLFWPMQNRKSPQRWRGKKITAKWTPRLCPMVQFYVLEGIQHVWKRNLCNAFNSGYCRGLNEMPQRVWTLVSLSAELFQRVLESLRGGVLLEKVGTESAAWGLIARSYFLSTLYFLFH